MRFFARVLVAVPVLTVALSACGGGTEPGVEPTPSASASAVPSAAPSAGSPSSAPSDGELSAELLIVATAAGDPAYCGPLVSALTSVMERQGEFDPSTAEGRAQVLENAVLLEQAAAIPALPEPFRSFFADSAELNRIVADAKGEELSDAGNELGARVFEQLFVVGGEAEASCPKTVETVSE